MYEMCETYKTCKIYKMCKMCEKCETYETYKAAFGCKTSDQIRTESPVEKDAFLPYLVRVYGFIKARACTSWRLQIATGWGLELRPLD